MDLDEVLPSVGEYGKYQKLVLWFVLLPGVFPCGFHAYNQLFMAATPDHWCYVPDLAQMEKENARNLSIPLETTLDGQLRFSKCNMYNISYENASRTFKNFDGIPTNTSTASCKNGWYFDEDYKSVVTEWNLVCDRDFLVTLGLVLLGASGLVGNYIFGYIQDGVGRKPAYFIYLLIQCIFGTATAFASNYVMWVIFRIGVGFTVPAILGTPYVMAIELVGPKYRVTVTILINIAYSLSLVSLAIIVWAVRDWRWMTLLTTLPFAALFATWWVLPESPRWLLARGRYDEAEKILCKMAKVNGNNSLSKDFLQKHIASKPQDADSKAPANQEQERYGIRHLFRHKNLRWKTVIITFLWFTNTSVYVGLSYYAPALGGDEYLNFFLAGAVEFPTYLFLWPAMERLGRRWTLCMSMIVGGTSCLATFVVQEDYLTTLVLYCMGKMGISSSFVVLPLMASELYPTVVRGLGMSLSSVIGMLGPIFIPLVNYLGSDMLTLPLIIMGALLVAGGLCSLLLPETLNKHLPQTLEDAEKSPLDCFACCEIPQKEDLVSEEIRETAI
ncbi:unnamed protein product [Callosobruchus maculatus]|uniref:Major facilitator superfamily (MFS) profile domain-containing protein n=1 Tax=Callosobruchus maculatus TaxID=64391 RepID=A0A653BLK6_CALMS|nr:unnamed protein product [Callosobruchus maculatus]